MEGLLISARFVVASSHFFFLSIPKTCYFGDFSVACIKQLKRQLAIL